MRDIKDLVVLVTGGGSGLGEATVRRMVRDGADVVICDLPSSNGISVAHELGEKCIFVATDVTSETDVQNALEVVKSKFHKLDAVVNCAGICVPQKTYNFENDTAHSLENFQKVLLVNTVGTFNVIRLAVGLMAKNQPDDDGQKGVIINTTSTSAFNAPAGQVAYAASKAAVVGMTRPLVKDLQSQGIRCCTVAPGLYDTPLIHGIPQEVTSSFTSMVPFPKRMGHPDEYADVVQTLIRNPYLNGCEIKIDGAVTSQIY